MIATVHDKTVVPEEELSAGKRNWLTKSGIKFEPEAGGKITCRCSFNMDTR